jgi:type II secretory pathway pseudopilin PulG
MIRTARTDRSDHAARGLGFTLVEVLVVISVIIMLAIILLPALVRYRIIIKTNITLTTVRQLDLACNAYKEDFYAFPPSSNATYGWPGAQLLPLFLIGYADNNGGTKGTPDPSGRLDSDDGVDGPGFRVVPRGKVYGPYAGAEKQPVSGAAPRWFVDAFGQPILYYRSTDPSTTINMYNYADNNATINSVSFVGPNASDLDYYAQGNVLNAPNPYLRKDFILMSPGADGVWASKNKTVDASDDVTNLYPNQ